MIPGYVPSVSRLPVPPAGLFSRSGGLGDMASVSTALRRRRRRGLILDLDDTLYPRERFVMSGLAAVAHYTQRAHGIDAGLAFGCMARVFASRHRGLELQALCERFGLDRAQVPMLVDLFRRHTPAIWLNHDAVAVLHELRAAGWHVAILTNGLPSVQFRKVAALGLAYLVDEVVYAEEHAPGGKPAAAAFRAALRALDLTADECVCAGDDVLRDVRGARAMGIRTIRVSRPHEPVTPAEDADAVIDSLRQLPGAASMLLELVTADVA